MSKSLSSAAVVIGALMVRESFYYVETHIFYHDVTQISCMLLRYLACYSDILHVTQISCLFPACMPPDNHSDFDLHLVQSVRNLRDLRKDLAAGIVN